jgi:hypothetical protein
VDGRRWLNDGAVFAVEAVEECEVVIELVEEVEVDGRSCEVSVVAEECDEMRDKSNHCQHANVIEFIQRTLLV